MEKNNTFWLILIGSFTIVAYFIMLIMLCSAHEKIDGLSDIIIEQEKELRQYNLTIEYLKGYLRAKESIICVTE